MAYQSLPRPDLPGGAWRHLLELPPEGKIAAIMMAAHSLS
jgi:hypothetical protein